MARGVKGTGKSKLTNTLKTYKFPLLGELVKTCTELCSCCNYGTRMGGDSLIVCDYYLMTKKLRGCKSGECDKFEKITLKRPSKKLF